MGQSERAVTRAETHELIKDAMEQVGMALGLIVPGLVRAAAGDAATRTLYLANLHGEIQRRDAAGHQHAAEMLRLLHATLEVHPEFRADAEH